MKGETMVSDQDIARGVEILLRQSQSDPQQNGGVSSVNGVVQQLGAKFGLDLSHKTNFIRDQINLLYNYNYHQQLPPVQPVSGDRFTGFQNHPQFLAAHFQQQQQQQQRYHLQQQQQQQQQFPFQFANFRAHAPPQNLHAPPPPQLQHHAPPQGNVVASTSPPPTAKSGSKGSKESTGAKRRGGAGGLNKLCGVSPELQAVVGEATMARTEIVKQLWVYIRKNNLQDPSNKRKIICDETLRAVFEVDCTDMFKMNKLLAKHILPYDPTKDSVPSKRQKVDVESTAEVPTEGAQPTDGAEATEGDKPTEGASVAVISDALALFLGTTRKEMLVPEASQRVFEYIKANNLEDSSSMTVHCDEKLRELFGCESIPVLGINELLARHHFFQSL